jgi:hypothetical protein
MKATLIFTLLAISPSAEPAGTLRATAPVVDLGEVKSGPLITHTFELKHTGSVGTITLTSVESGCGCAKPELSAKTLAPGESATLTIRVNTLTQREGPNTWPVRVCYAIEVGGQKTNSELDLKLIAKVVREISVTPPLLAITTTGAITQTLKVEDRREKPLTVTKISSTNTHILATATAATSSSGVSVQEVRVVVNDTLPAGSHDDTLTLHTDDPSCPILLVSLKVHRRHANEVTATPGTATVRFTRGQAEASTLVQLRHNGKPVNIAKVECSTPGLTFKHSEGADRVATVRVIVSAAKAGASGQAEVVVTLAEPSGGKVVIPVSWYEP